ncbi:HAD family hydrolase [uncultured Desulfosarcina sp.]|uniref:HAD family hydrolase n=1 Tax=uncultured Desulfosarcina sp. TaxID=218289 RepID=UPI0029C6392E|nr:HAD family hydrolase [uncultured Desulfosarcina sp.]
MAEPDGSMDIVGCLETEMNTDDRPTRSFQAIIFDLDGTLLDTLADIGDSVNCMLAEYGFPGHTPDDYTRFIGNGIKMLVIRALPVEGCSGELVDACVRRAREIYWENWNNKTRLYEGIIELLDGLKTMGLPLAVLSNKPHDFTVRYVDAYFDKLTFKVVMGQNDHFPVKPDPASALDIARQIGLAPQTFLFVGDSAVDMKTATAAGMHAVGVAWGFRGPKELLENGCQTLVTHPLEILSLLQFQ